MAAREGVSTQQEILQACARCFCREGYGRTSTHRIAAEARVSQAALYHYFSGKEEMLLTLLLETVQPSVAFADEMAAGPADGGADAVVRLRRLCAFDARLLSEAPDNLGLLYFLPEVQGEAFARFHEERQQLLRGYTRLVSDVLGVPLEDGRPQAELVLGLVESVITRRLFPRDEPATPSPDLPLQIADAAVALLVARQDGRTPR